VYIAKFGYSNTIFFKKSLYIYIYMFGYLLEPCIKIWLAIFIIFQWIISKFWLFHFQKIIEFMTQKFRNFTRKRKAAPWCLTTFVCPKTLFWEKKKKGFGQGLTYWHQPNCLGMRAIIRTLPKMVPFLSTLVLACYLSKFLCVEPL